MEKQTFIDCINALEKQIRQDIANSELLAKVFKDSHSANLLPDNHYLTNILYKIMARNITEILDNANSATELQELIDLWNEIANNKKQYPLTEIYKANKQIRRLALKSKGEDIEIGKFYNFLDAQR